MGALAESGAPFLFLGERSGPKCAPGRAPAVRSRRPRMAKAQNRGSSGPVETHGGVGWPFHLTMDPPRAPVSARTWGHFAPSPEQTTRYAGGN